MADLKYNIINTIGILSTSNKGWTKEINLISWNDRDPKLDIREWSSDHSKMGKGITLTEEEAVSLRNALSQLFPFVEEVKEENEDFEDEEERYFLKDFGIFKGMYKRLLKAFELYNVNNNNPEFREFQKEFLCALNDFSNGYSVDSYNIDMFYESTDGIVSAQINLSRNNLYISSGGYSNGEFGGDSYTDWVIDFFAEGNVDNSYDIEPDSFDVFCEILGSEAVKVEFY